MILSFVAEHSLSLNLTPSLVELVKALSIDSKALSKVQLSRTAASYKLTNGLGKNIKDSLILDLRKYPFSINVDESMSKSKKEKVLTILVSYVKVNSSGVHEISLSHLCSLEVQHVDAKTICDKIEEVFKDNDIPFQNLVSCLFDSCNIMRGKHNGVETRLRHLEPGLLDVDGDSCHHMHNATKVFCKPFESHLESLFNDLHADDKFSPDQRWLLKQICTFIGVPFTVPSRFVSHRWLSVYDVSVSTKRLFPAYMILYFGFMSQDNKESSREMLDALYDHFCVSKSAQDFIEENHATLARKNMTTEGKERKQRIISKLWTLEKKTKMILNFYIGLLAQLKEYVCVFQSKQTMIHQLHDRQIQAFVNFLGCFLKPDAVMDHVSIA